MNKSRDINLLGRLYMSPSPPAVFVSMGYHFGYHRVIKRLSKSPPGYHRVSFFLRLGNRRRDKEKGQVLKMLKAIRK